MNKAQAGQLGGLTTSLRASTEGMRERGRLGGRPRLTALADKKGQQLASSVTLRSPDKKEGRLPNDLRDLKMLWLRKQEGEVKSSPGEEE